MRTTDILNWIRTGLLTLPLYGLLTFWSTLDPQPDQSKDPETWARFVSTPSYLVSHLFGSIGGTIFAILGIFALGAYLAIAARDASGWSPWSRRCWARPCSS
jgi:hypothetical protein